MTIFSFHNLQFLSHGPYSLSIEEHETIGVTGPSGIGKTQLLRALADLIDHDGEVEFAGVPAGSFRPHEWRKKVALVSADPVWWHDLVGDHFLTSSPLLIPFLQQLGFAEDVMPWQVNRLSMGERQRLALVRSLVIEPKILLLDEPTSALDDVTTEMVERLLRDYSARKETAVLWVSHDKHQLQRIASRRFALAKNTLIELV